MWLVTIVALLALETQAFRSKEVCCPRIGCFNDDNNAAMSHLPVPKCPDDVNFKFILITRANRDLSNEITLDQMAPEYDPSKLTIFTSHGWFGQADMDWMNDLVDGLLHRFDANIIVADWKKGSMKVYYPKAAANVATVGAEMAYFMTGLTEKHGDSYDNMWCIGFSLGAHVCGHAGMRTDGQIARVTGLDPAGPSFAGRTIMNGINPTAAKFVDVIHADGGGIISYYGLLEPRGHMDFYPNGGADQPGCYFGRKKREAQQFEDMNCIDFEGWIDPESCPYSINIFIGCDHYRGIYYFLDTLEHDNCHVARHICTDHNKIPESCSETEETEMGVFADQNNLKEGLFYMETGRKKPFCKY